LDEPVDIHADTARDAIRVAARALIIEEGRLLVMTYSDDNGSWCVTPGGGIAKKETLVDGLRREVMEELGLEIEVGDVVYVRELLGASAKVLYGGITEETHQLELFFRCLRSGEPSGGTRGDNFSTGWEWVPLGELAARNFFPEPLADRIAHDVSTGFQPHNNYLGNA